MKITRRCSHCNNNGHNSRTCSGRGVKLFGVRLDRPIWKSASVGSLVHYSGGGGGASSSNGGGESSPDRTDGGGLAATAEKDVEGGYASEGFVKGSAASHRERKKGMAWTEEEHKKFLLGLRMLGKGDWRGISRHYVVSRTPTQVASHAQKYFIRQSNLNRRKKRCSLFDIVLDKFGDAQDFLVHREELEAHGRVPLLAPPPPRVHVESESTCSSSREIEVAQPAPMPETMSYPYPIKFPAFYPAYYPVPFPFYPGYVPQTMESKAPEVLKPTAVHSTNPGTRQLMGMSNLSMIDSFAEGGAGSSSVACDQLGGQGRRSAFNGKHRLARASIRVRVLYMRSSGLSWTGAFLLIQYE